MKKRIEAVLIGSPDEVKLIENQFRQLTYNDNVASFAVKEITT